MADPEHGLRQLVEEGTRSARQPPLADLRRRARRRRTVREVATVTAVAAAVLAIFPLVAWERSATSTPGPTAPHTHPPTPTGPAEPLLASPTETVPGGTVTLTGTGCAPGKAVTLGIRWDRGAKLSLSMEEQKKSPGQPQTTATTAGKYQLASVNALPTGSFEARVRIPTSPAINKPTLWASCRTSSPSHHLTQYVSIVVRSPG
ncbi:hypothetical protein ACFWP5_27420 [Streptomyces sp. NPDC058469]|uniref:hypothetical protein n=1 Tax=Streptomyces sp. NPDC058469 TaxID=3346514 RepID=UPI003658B5C7